MPDNHAEPPSPSIFTGVDKLIDTALQLTADLGSARESIGKAPHHGHKESCQRLSAQPLDALDAAALISAMYQKLSANWDGSSYHKSSKENWRLESNVDMSPENDSPEVCLERAIVRVLNLTDPKPNTWSNQVPVASGLVHPTADRSRKIDIVHDLGDETFDFIELKVSSDTPLYAAMEILKYGVVYAFCRHLDPARQSNPKHRELMEAKRIRLCVLAPAAYYASYNLAWLEERLNSGLEEFRINNKLLFGLDFRFEKFTLFECARVDWKPRSE